MQKNQVDRVGASAFSDGDKILFVEKCQERYFLSPTASGSTQNFSKYLTFYSKF
jgi:hypothetical protein